MKKTFLSQSGLARKISIYTGGLSRNNLIIHTLTENSHGLGDIQFNFGEEPKRF